MHLPILVRTGSFFDPRITDLARPCLRDGAGHPLALSIGFRVNPVRRTIEDLGAAPYLIWSFTPGGTRVTSTPADRISDDLLHDSAAAALSLTWDRGFQETHVEPAVLGVLQQPWFRSPGAIPLQRTFWQLILFGSAILMMPSTRAKTPSLFREEMPGPITAPELSRNLFTAFVNTPVSAHETARIGRHISRFLHAYLDPDLAAAEPIYPGISRARFSPEVLREVIIPLRDT